MRNIGWLGTNKEQNRTGETGSASCNKSQWTVKAILVLLHNVVTTEGILGGFGTMYSMKNARKRQISFCSKWHERLYNPLYLGRKSRFCWNIMEADRFVWLLNILREIQVRWKWGDREVTGSLLSLSISSSVHLFLWLLLYQSVYFWSPCVSYWSVPMGGDKLWVQSDFYTRLVSLLFQTSVKVSRSVWHLRDACRRV